MQDKYLKQDFMKYDEGQGELHSDFIVCCNYLEGIGVLVKKKLIGPSLVDDLICAREYLTDSETRTLLGELNRFFESRVEVKRIRNGEHQTLETLINEEALLFAKYLRDEAKSWIPRVPGK